ncbi:MAG TPA: type II toxin-antitoxin system HicB family antitoxin [Chloroflexota bacterium]|nr:type II toxin-antitoxin system HicB family antitoxin [Chloroflexota bacterium]HUM67736.1 type II toxin-antitoxin system HicB family antitoxin [Chloroflexota bacterium]
METIYKLPLLLEPQPEGGFTITCPLLPELITEADTLEEVTPHVADALEAIIEAYQDLGRPLPAVIGAVKT